ncbi:MAG: hypothetical protein HXY50_17135 [Ignavibacteriaceae bacterium]|nr:hypothetical protein [Ignavibacteriaceae bacterium]
MDLLLIISFTLLGSLLSVALAGLVLRFPSQRLDTLTRVLIPYAIGCEIHSRAGAMILIGDSLHNFVDGVAIAVAEVSGARVLAGELALILAGVATIGLLQFMGPGHLD